MISWIESQHTGVIILLVAALCYALAALVFVASVMVARTRLGIDLKATSPVMLTPLAVVTALLVTFLAARVWSNVDHANSHVAQEANALREVVLLADALPEGPRGALRGSIKDYLQYVEAEEWPAMTRGRASLASVPPGIEAMQSTLLAFRAGDAREQFAQQTSIVAAKRALEARQSRIALSRLVISDVQWGAIFTLDVLILLTIAMVHIDRRVTTAVNLLSYSTAMAACLVLLMVNDRPFTAGGITVQPQALREIGLGLP